MPQTLRSYFCYETLPRETNFTPLRLIAAMLVLLGHGYRIFDNSFDPLKNILRGETLQETALHAFFVFSGYLIMQSRMQHTLTGYTRNRALRIYPALLVNITILAIMHSKPEFLINGLGFYLEGIKGINNPLWTIQLELWLYVIVGLLGWRAVLLTPIVLLLPYQEMQSPVEATYFAMGSLAMLVKLKPRLWMAAPLIFYHFMPSYVIGMSALILWLTLATPKVPFKWPDISYGLYLYAWPIQLLLVGLGMSFVTFQAAALGAAMLCGYLSMRFIEMPALRLRVPPTKTFFIQSR